MRLFSNIKTSLILPVMAGILLLSSFIAIVSPQFARAEITLDNKVACQQSYDGKIYNVDIKGDALKAYNLDCQGTNDTCTAEKLAKYKLTREQCLQYAGPCTHKADAVTKKDTITCEDAATEKQAMLDQLIPLVQLTCGDAPQQTDNGGTNTAYTDCYNKTQAAYNTCNAIQVAQDREKAVAACLAPKLSVIAGKKISTDQVTSALDAGSQAAQAHIQAAKDDKDKKACESQVDSHTGEGLGKVWNSETKTCEDGDNNGKSTCKVDGIGWIICPVMTFMSSIIDESYNTVGKALLTVPPLSTDIKAPLYTAWSIMRNFANVAFVIAFLIIIFSQLTSFGVSNYGIKKLLPKLVVAAILVNISYWVCAVAVDLSNIVGSSINNLFDNISTNSIKIDDKSGIFDGTNVWTNITGALLAGSAAIGVTLYAGLSVLLPLVIAALLIIVTVVVTLTLRQALIILLIVVSPLAFVALLLPNTEGLFKKWRQMLQALLLLFPIIGAVFGLSKLAGKIIMASSDNFFVQLMGAATQIVVLVLVYELIKGALKLFGRLGAFVNNPNKGFFDRMKKGAEGYREYRQNVRRGRALSGNGPTFPGGFKRSARRDAIRAGAKAQADRSQNAYIANQIGKNAGFANRVAGGGSFVKASQQALQLAIANAKLTVEKAEIEEVKAESIEVRNLGTGQLRDLINDTTGQYSEARKAAAVQRLIATGNATDYEDIVDKLGKDSNSSQLLRSTLADSLSEHGPAFLKGSDIDNIRKGAMGSTSSYTDAQGNQKTVKVAGSLKETATNNVAAGVLSQEKLVSDTAGNLQYAFDSANAKGKQNMIDTAAAAAANPEVAAKIKHNKNAIDALRTGVTPGPTGPRSAFKPDPNNPGNTILDLDPNNP